MPGPTRCSHRDHHRWLLAVQAIKHVLAPQQKAIMEPSRPRMPGTCRGGWHSGLSLSWRGRPRPPWLPLSNGEGKRLAGAGRGRSRGSQLQAVAGGGLTWQEPVAGAAVMRMPNAGRGRGLGPAAGRSAVAAEQGGIRSRTAGLAGPSVGDLVGWVPDTGVGAGRRAGAEASAAPQRGPPDGSWGRDVPAWSPRGLAWSRVASAPCRRRVVEWGHGGGCGSGEWAVGWGRLGWEPGREGLN
ncbi:hypothetical protein PVAP13_8NG042605 [Panicum virgatum]|uniref:Uncharacterized protein n=1 Tax=Panicum virgatum TaxID=38727 RepID=A0A8T0P5P5_PANVG|nr:hypothetical protein PVAP13_8NG042605 [Panicum virgatum]